MVCGFLRSFNCPLLFSLFYFIFLMTSVQTAFPAGHEAHSVFSNDAYSKNFHLLLVIISDTLRGRKLQFAWLMFVTAFKRRPLIQKLGGVLSKFTVLDKPARVYHSLCKLYS